MFQTPQPGEILPGSLQALLRLSDEQKKQVAAFHKEARGKVDKLLTEPQRKEVKDWLAHAPPGI